jgi:hypothetical protein
MRPTGQLIRQQNRDELALLAYSAAAAVVEGANR